MLKRLKFVFPFAALAILVGLFVLSRQTVEEVPREKLALMTSLPLYWGEASEFAELASGQGELPWVRARLEERYDLYPIDSLSTEIELGREAFDRILIAQPRAISPEDNVALDEWVSQGGRLLLVIDPLLTGSYSVPLGDPSHPTTVGLIPPVLERWGIGIRYDENQAFALQSVESGGLQLPFAMAGEAHLLGSGTATCTISHEGILARCKLGKGRVTMLVDAALFELHQESSNSRKSLLKLTEMAF